MKYADGVTFHAYEPADGAQSACAGPALRGQAGGRLEGPRRGAPIEATGANASIGGWRRQPAGGKAVAAIDAGTASTNPLGLVNSPTRGWRVLRVTLTPDS